MILLKQHPLNTVLTPMSAAELAALKADIADNGQIFAIVTHEHAILDGWHRYLCCIELGIEPRLKELDDDIDPADLLRSLNLTRRHLTAAAHETALAAIASPHPLPDPPRQPPAPVPVPVTTLEAAISRIAAVCGADAAAAIACTGHATLSKRETLLWSNMTDRQMLATQPLVIGQRWNPSRVLRLLHLKPDPRSRLESLIQRASISSIPLKFQLDGFSITVSKNI